MGIEVLAGQVIVLNFNIDKLPQGLKYERGSGSAQMSSAYEPREPMPSEPSSGFVNMRRGHYEL